jgi:hypothetical protein
MQLPSAILHRVGVSQHVRFHDPERDPVVAEFFVVVRAAPSVPQSTAVVQVVKLPAAEESPSVKIDGVCRENPYAASFHSSLDSIRSKADAWLENVDNHLQKANKEEMKAHNWARFFPFDAMAECNTTCVGAVCEHDKSKIVCGMEELQTKKKCVVCSMGGNNEWQFELDILEQTPPCEVHTFDCTGNITRFDKPKHPRLSFHHICLGAEHVPCNQDKKCNGGRSICGDILTLCQIEIMLGHKRIDLFKIDIEGCEWPIFESWPELSDANQASDMVLPMQIIGRSSLPNVYASLISTRKQTREARGFQIFERCGQVAGTFVEGWLRGCCS